MLFPFSRRRLRHSALSPGRYLTDGCGLFRVLSHFDDSRSILVVIEDAVTLEPFACAAIELERMGFRSVRIGEQPSLAKPRPEPRSRPLRAV